MEMVNPQLFGTAVNGLYLKGCSSQQHKKLLHVLTIALSRLLFEGVHII
jgi:hypothetical protein